MKVGIFLVIILIICTDIFDTISQLCIKLGINHLDVRVNSLKKAVSFLFSLLQKPRLWVSFVFSAASPSVWLLVLSKVDLNFAYSIDSMRYIFITFASLIFLKERVGVIRWFGIVSIVFGILMVTLI